MLIKTGGPTEQTVQKTIEVTVEQPPKDWGMEIISGIVIALVVATIIRLWTKRK